MTGLEKGGGRVGAARAGSITRAASAAGAARAAKSAHRSLAPAVAGNWRAVYLLAPIVALACLRELWAPDEPRYAQVAREAASSGSWLVLRLCGELYPDKPPLVYWMSAACAALFGWHEWALRIPSVCATVGSAWLCSRIARRWFGIFEATWAPLLYLATAMVIEIGGRLQLDPVLSFFCLAALERMTAVEGSGAQLRRRTWLAGAFLGMAALAKGPVAWLHAAIALLAWSVLPASQRFAPRRSTSAWIGFAIAAIGPVLAWAVLAGLREPDLLRPLLVGQHVGRIAGDAPHVGPPWEHAVELPLLLFPTTLIVFAGLLHAWRAWRGRVAAEAGLVRMAAWLAATLLVFSLIPPKRELYLLPVYPAAALIAARALAVAVSRAVLARWIALGTSGALAMIGLGLVVAPLLVPLMRDSAPPLAAGGLALALVAWRSIRRWRAGSFEAWAWQCLCAWSTAALLIVCVVVPRVNAVKSARRLAESLSMRVGGSRTVPCVGVHPEGYRFYGNVQTHSVAGDAAARDHELRSALQRGGSDFVALVRDRDWDALEPELRTHMQVLERWHVGSRNVLVVGASQ